MAEPDDDARRVPARTAPAPRSRLAESESAGVLAVLPGWAGDAGRQVQIFRFDDERTTIAFVDALVGGERR